MPIGNLEPEHPVLYTLTLSELTPRQLKIMRAAVGHMSLHDWMEFANREDNDNERIAATAIELSPVVDAFSEALCKYPQ